LALVRSHGDVIDTRRNAAYITIGNVYTLPSSAKGQPPEDGNQEEAFVALDLDTGRILWHKWA